MPRDRFVMEVDGARRQPTIYLINNSRVTKEEFAARWSGFKLNEAAVAEPDEGGAVKVWVETSVPCVVSRLTLTEPECAPHRKRQREVTGTAGKVLVDRERLTQALEVRTHRGHPLRCCWYDCEWGRGDVGTPHSGTCPLRVADQAGDADAFEPGQPCGLGRRCEDSTTAQPCPACGRVASGRPAELQREEP